MGDSGHFGRVEKLSRKDTFRHQGQHIVIRAMLSNLMLGKFEHAEYVGIVRDTDELVQLERDMLRAAVIGLGDEDALL